VATSDANHSMMRIKVDLRRTNPSMSGRSNAESPVRKGIPPASLPVDRRHARSVAGCAKARKFTHFLAFGLTFLCWGPTVTVRNRHFQL
jgi:hypothetical protein